MNDLLTRKSVGLIHKIFNIYIKNKKNYTASTKTKSEVRGGGRKPWKQKGTGQARAGSIRSSIWVGGGVSFGPKPHSVFRKANKKERQLAILQALKLKKNDCLIIPDSLLMLNEPKTKALIKLLNPLNVLTYNKILILASNISENLKISSQNLSNVTLSSLANLNLEKILIANKIVITETVYNLIYK